MISKPGDTVQSHSRLRASFVRHSDFDAVRITRKRHRKVWALARQMFERFFARSNNGFLQIDNFFGGQTGGLSEVTRSAARRGRQPCVGVNLQPNAFGFSAHCGCSRVRHRKLPGSPGNNTGRLRRASR